MTKRTKRTTKTTTESVLKARGSKADKPNPAIDRVLFQGDLFCPKGLENFVMVSFKTLGIASCVDLPIYQRVVSFRDEEGPLPRHVTIGDAKRTGDTGSAQDMENAMRFMREAVAERSAFLALVVSREQIEIPGHEPFEAVMFNLDHRTFGRRIWFAPILDGGMVEQTLYPLPQLAATARGIPTHIFPRRGLVDLHTATGVHEFLMRVCPALGIRDASNLPVFAVYVRDFDAASPKPDDPSTTIVTWSRDTDNDSLVADMQRHVQEINPLLALYVSKEWIREEEGRPEEVVLLRLFHKTLAPQSLFSRLLEDGTVENRLYEASWPLAEGGTRMVPFFWC